MDKWHRGLDAFSGLITLAPAQCIWTPLLPGLNKFSRPILEKIIRPNEKKIQHFYNGMFMTRRKLLGGNGGRYSRGPGNSEQKRQPRTLKNGQASKTQHKKLKTIFWPEPLV